VQPLVARQLVILYFDSCGHPEHLAGILLCGSKRGLYFSTKVSAGMEHYLDPNLCDNRNTQLEALTPLLCLATFKEQLRGKDVLAYGDNTSALRALSKGYSPSKHMCDIVAGFWTLAMTLSCNVWLEWVCSEANPADPLSRPHESPGLSYADHHGWARVEVICPPPTSRLATSL